MSGPDLAGEARGTARAARSHEDAGRRSEARRLYLDAASLFLRASRHPTADAGLHRDLAEAFLQKARALAPPAPRVAPAVNGSAGGGSDDVPAPTFGAMPVPDVTFQDVAGMAEVKREINRAIVHPIKRPDLFQAYGRAAGGGILLWGPPGCGKTHIARAAAGECGVPFYNLRASDVLGKWVGDNEKNLRAAFEAARAHAPAILFIDEIDALARKRGGTTSSYAQRLVNEFLTLLDGVDAQPDRPLLVLGATNEPWSLDPAFRRPGRFNRLVYVPPPDYDARLELLRLGTRTRPIASDVDLERVALATEGHSSADVKQLVDDATDRPLLEALSGSAPRPLGMPDFEAALAARSSSLGAWFEAAERSAAAQGEEDLFRQAIRTTSNGATPPPS